jgi:hypothetical protein
MLLSLAPSCPALASKAHLSPLHFCALLNFDAPPLFFLTSPVGLYLSALVLLLLSLFLCHTQATSA